ncbi:MAG: hypothetical protein FWE36_00040 [Erysipelotrichales bacterium]|nr:hypothetical protein [Erysipelotrichales bacterium]
MKKTFDVNKFISDLGDDLIKVFDRSSADGIHPDEIGKTKEINISKQIEAILPNGVGVGRGFVFDSYGNMSNQCDIILYEKHIIPVFTRDANDEYSFFPCEGVIAVGEIKSTLDLNILDDSLTKLAKIKKLKRKIRISDRTSFRKYLNNFTIATTKEDEYMPEKNSNDNIYTFIFAREDKIANRTMIEMVIKKFASSPYECLDNIFSQNNKYYARFKYNESTNAFSILDGADNSFGSLRCSTNAFGLLVNRLMLFIDRGRSQKFSLSDYYSTGTETTGSWNMFNDANIKDLLDFNQLRK